MPNVKCVLIECIFNQGGECSSNEINLNYNGICADYEEKDES